MYSLVLADNIHSCSSWRRLSVARGLLPLVALLLVAWQAVATGNSPIFATLGTGGRRMLLAEKRAAFYKYPAFQPRQ